MNLVKENAGEAIINNPAIPNEKNDEAVQTTASSIMDSLKGMLSSGKANDVLSMFSQQPEGNAVANSPVAAAASSNLISTLMSKFGIDSNQASGIASKLIPNVMNQFVNKTNDPNDNSFDIQGIFNSLSGNKTSGLDISSMVSKFGGNALDKNHDGKVDFSDLTAAFSGGKAEGGEGGGGLMDKISGLFGK